MTAPVVTDPQAPAGSARPRRLRRIAWLILVGALVVIGALAAVPKPASQAQESSTGLGDAYDSVLVEKVEASLPSARVSPALIVVSHADGTALTAADSAAVLARLDAWKAAAGATAAVPLRIASNGTVGVATLIVPEPDASLDSTAQTNATSAKIDGLRRAIGDDRPAGLVVQVTGPPALTTDIAAVFDGANFTLLTVTAGIVALLLLITYRSPVLWILPLLVVGGAEQLSGVLNDLVLPAVGVPADPSTSGITSVLVFGAATDYALLLMSRYRDELRRTASVPEAMFAAVRRTAEPVLASGGTVILAVLVLTLSDQGGYRALGLSCAVGVAVALPAALVVLPAALAVCGRWVFWPFVPRFAGVPGESADAADPAVARPGAWERVGRAVARRPIVVTAASLALLAALAAGGLGVRTGLSQAQQFRVEPESIAAATTLARGFPAGETSPAVVVTTPANAQKVIATAEALDGVASATAGEATSSLALVSVVLRPEPGTTASDRVLVALRAALADVPGPAATDGRTVVGGTTAANYDQDQAVAHDTRIIVPLILLIVFVVLLVLLRGLVGPVLLVGTVLASYFAAFGLSWLLSVHVFGFAAFDPGVVPLSFLFLVALGVDYNIFLIARAREEARTAGTREGTISALSATGGVITSAGVLLAAVFAVLGVLPLITLTQIGIVVCIGVLLDALLVRTVLVPALVFVLGDRFWWPGRITARA